MASENCEKNNHFKVLSTSSCLTVLWDNDFVKEDVGSVKIESYEIKFRESGTKKFENVQASNDENRVEINGLKSDTLYDINVYWCNEDGENYILFKKTCKTEESKSHFLLENAFSDKTRTPFIYYLKPVSTAEYLIDGTKSEADDGVDRIRGFDIKVKHQQEEKNKPNTENAAVIDRIRVLDMIAEYRPSIHTHEEKTLLLVGATGTGKSTLIDALINYIAGVSYKDNHRFSLISKTDEEKERADNQSESQTSSVTVYRIPPMEGLMYSCGVNIIDTPGFNDTRENFDKRITNQIRELFEKRISHLDAVIIVVTSSTIRLTPGQEHVFSSILGMFGKNIGKNIFVATTFDDSGELTCLSVLHNANIPYADVFRFNNSNVLTKFSSDQVEDSNNQRIWNTRTKNFAMLFKTLENTAKTTVTSSVEVMRARQSLEIQLIALEEKLSEQAQDIANYKIDKTVLVALQNETPENRQKCLYKRQVSELQIIYHGWPSLNCEICRKTCHKTCFVLLENFKWTCVAMDGDKCTICDAACDINVHVFSRSIYKTEYVDKLLSGEDVVNRQKERTQSFTRLQHTLLRVEHLIVELKSKALRKDTLTLVQYVQDLVTKEEKDRKQGYKMRIQIQEKILDHLMKNESIGKLSIDSLISE